MRVIAIHIVHNGNQLRWDGNDVDFFVVVVASVVEVGSSVDADVWYGVL